MQIETENMSRSQTADTETHRSTEEAASTSSGRDYIGNDGQRGRNSQASCGTAYNSESDVGDYFSDTDKFIKSVDMLKRLVGFDLLDKTKRFLLKKHITTLRKAKNGQNSPRVKK